MRTALGAVLVFIIASQFMAAECVTFIDSDGNPAFSVDTDTHAVTFHDQAEAAFNRFQCLGSNDVLPSDLSFMAREAAIRYAALDLTPPATWIARYVREVFRSREDIVIFLERYYSSSKRK